MGTVRAEVQREEEEEEEEVGGVIVLIAISKREKDGPVLFFCSFLRFYTRVHRSREVSWHL